MLYFILTILGFLIIATIIFFNTGQSLPKGIDKLVREVQNEPLPELIPGKTGYANNNGVKIFYNSIGNPYKAKGTVLFVCGHSSTLLDWQPHIYQPLLDAGYHILRYDNRGLGMSDWLDNWTKEKAHTLEDMAKDGMAVLDALNIPKAHIVGMSMGGMIAQRMAISHSDRVHSLTSVMSTGWYDDPKLTNLPKGFLANFIRYFFRYGLKRTEANAMKWHLAVILMLKGKGNYMIDHKEVLQKALYTLRKRKGFNLKVRDQHTLAIQKSGSRYAELSNIKAPTLVIHGMDDPLVYFEHAEKYAPMIPQCKTLYLEGMGHDMPAAYMDKMATAMLQTFQEANVTQAS